MTGLSSATSDYRYDEVRMTNVENVEFTDTIITLDTALNDATYFYGDAYADNLTGTDADDIFDSAGGDDKINGKGGTDTVLIFDERDNYEITVLDGVVKIKGLSSATSDYRYDTITLTNIETIVFSDQTVQVSDLTSKPLTSKSIDQSSNDDNDLDTEPSNSDDGNGTITLPDDDDQFMNGFDLPMIDLPIAADNIDAGLSDSIDSLNDLILIEDSMELSFDVFSGDDELIVSMVKPMHSPSIHNDTMIPWENINDQVVWEDWNYESL